MSKQQFYPRFYIGQVIVHNKFDYRGVIVDVDAEYSGTDEWYEEVARSRPPKDMPWYHVLVHGSEQMTYVAERHLDIDDSKQPVNHPAIDHFFESFDEGIYKMRQKQ